MKRSIPVFFNFLSFVWILLSMPNILFSQTETEPNGTVAQSGTITINSSTTVLGDVCLGGGCASVDPTDFWIIADGTSGDFTATWTDAIVVRLLEYSTAARNTAPINTTPASGVAQALSGSSFYAFSTEAMPSGTLTNYSVDITLSASNSPPTASSFVASNGPFQGLTYTFNTADFSYSDADSDPLSFLRIVSIPANGTLYTDADNDDILDGGEELADNDMVSLADLDAGNLQYFTSGTSNASFDFDVNDGTDFSTITYTATLNVIPIPSVTLALSPPSRTESNTSNNTITATLSNSYGAPVTVPLSFSGTATLTDDFTRSGTSINISSGSTSGDVVLNNVDDALSESNETIIVDIDESGLVNSTEGSPNQVTFTINDDDIPSVTFSVSSGTIGNAGIDANIIATFSADIREADASTILNSEIPSLFTLTLGGSPVSFSGTFNGTNVITINPDDNNIGNNFFGSEDYVVTLLAGSVESVAGSVDIPTANETITAETLGQPAASPPINIGTITSSSIEVSWTGNPDTERYLLVLRQGNLDPSDPSDGTPVSDDLDFSDGNGDVNILNILGANANTFTFNGLDPLTTYSLELFPYNNSGSSINYRNGGSNDVQRDTDCDPPVGNVTVFSFTAESSSSLTFEWTPSGTADGALVLAESGNNPSDIPTFAEIAVPVNGTSYTGDLDFGMGENLGGGTRAVFSGATSGTTPVQIVVEELTSNRHYRFVVYEFNNTFNGPCYTTSPVTDTENTPTRDFTTTISNGSGVVTIPSTATASGTAVAAFVFEVRDFGTDGSDTDMRDIIIRAGTGNEVSNWSQVIADAELQDDEFGPSGRGAHGTVTIGTDFIQIDDINTDGGDPELGEVNNGTTKTFTLFIWLRTDINTAFGGEIDGLNFEFSLIANGTDVLTDNTTASEFLPGTGTTSNADGGTNNEIVVDATDYNFTQQPPATVAAGANVTPQPQVEAVDENGNRDLNYAPSSITVNAPAGVINTPVIPADLLNGVVTFPTNFQYTGPGNGQLTVTDVGDGGFSETSTPVTVTASVTFAELTGGIASSPLASASTDQALLGFSATASGALNFTGIDISTSNGTANGRITNIRLVESTNNNTFEVGEEANVIAGVSFNVTGSAIELSGFSEALATGVPRNFFLIADVEGTVTGVGPSPTPSLTLSFDDPDVSVSAGGGVSNFPEITGDTFTFADVTNANAINVVPSIDPVNNGDTGGNLQITVTFDEAMNTSIIPSLTLNPVPSSLSFNAISSVFTNPTTYIAVFTISDANEDIDDIDIQVSGGQDISGNNQNVNNFPNEFSIDNIAPTVVITRNAVTNGNVDQTNDNDVSFDLQFSEPINPSTFAIGDIVVNNTGVTFNALNGSTIVNSGDDQNFTVNITGIAGNSGTLGITVGPNIEDDAGSTMDANSGASPVFTFDNQAPVLTITRQPVTNGTFAQTNDSQVGFDLVFNEPINSTTFTISDITINSVPGLTFTPLIAADLTNPSSDNRNFELLISGISGTGTIGITVDQNIEDPATNTLAADVGPSNVFTIDNVGPTLVITRNPTTNGNVDDTNDDVVSFDLAFNEVVSNFTIADIVVNATTVTFAPILGSDLVDDGDGQNFTLMVRNIQGDGSLSITVGPNINDALGNLMSGPEGPSSAFTIDNTVPSVIFISAVPTFLTESEVGPGQFVVTIQFNDVMDGTLIPNLSFPTAGENASGLLINPSGVFSTTTLTNDTYTITFEVFDNDIDIDNIDIQVNNAFDFAGNAIIETVTPVTQNLFSADLSNPTIVSITPSVLTVTDANDGPNGFNLTIRYSDDMDISGANDPIVSFPVEMPQTNTLTFNPGGSAWTNARTYVASYDVDGSSDEEISDIDVNVSGAVELSSGNAQEDTLTPNIFNVNTDNAEVNLVQARNVDMSLGDGFYNDVNNAINGRRLNIELVFDRNVSISGGVPTIELNSGGVGTFQTGSGTPVLVFRYLIQDGENSPEGAFDITNGATAVNLNGATLLDDAGNIAVVNTLPSPGTAGSISANQNITIDTNEPTVDLLNPLNGEIDVNINRDLEITFNEEVLGVNNTNNLRIREAGQAGNFQVFNTSLLIPTSNNIVTIVHADFDEQTDYFVEIDPNSITDRAGNFYAGIINDTEWAFQTFGTPIIDVRPEFVCLESTGEIIRGQFFTGIDEFLVGGETGVSVESFMVVNDSTLSFDLPGASMTNMESGTIFFRKNAENGNPERTFETDALSDTLIVGPRMAELTPLGNETLCNEFSNTETSFQVDIFGGDPDESGNQYSFDLNVNGSLEENIGNYVSGSSFNSTPPSLGTNTYSLNNVTDARGCLVPASGLPLPADFIDIEVNERAVIDIDPVEVQCLAIIDIDDPIELTAEITGTVPQATWSLTEGFGDFSNPSNRRHTGGIDMIDYTLEIQDIALDSVVITLTSDDDPTMGCAATTETVSITFTTSAFANAGNNIVACPDDLIANGNTVQLNGSVGGGVSNGSWSTITSGDFDDPNSLNPIYQLSNDELDFLTLDPLNTIDLTLTPGTSTCGSPASDVVSISLGPNPQPTIASSDGNLVCVGDELVNYAVNSAESNEVNWQVPTIGGTELVSGQGTDQIFVNWGNLSGTTEIRVVEIDSATGCGSVTPVVFNIELNELPLVSLELPVTRNFPLSTDTVRLQGNGATDLGSTLFSGTGVFSNANDEFFFSPAQAGETPIVPHEITYFYAPDSTGCTGSVTEEFIVFAGDVIEIVDDFGNTVEALSSSVCANDTAFFIQLNEVFENNFVIDGFQFDEFIGPGIESSLDGRFRFNPSIILGDESSALIEIIYTQRNADSTDVREFGRQELTVNQITTPIPLVDSQEDFCDNELPIDLGTDNSLASGQIFTYSTISGPDLITNTGSTGFQFDPRQLPPQAGFERLNIEIQYSYLDQNGCTSLDTLFRTIAPQPPPATISQDLLDDSCFEPGEEIALIGFGVEGLPEDIRSEFEWFEDDDLNADSEDGDTAVVDTDDFETFYPVQTINACPSPFRDSVVVAINVEPDFEWENICANSGATNFGITGLASSSLQSIEWFVNGISEFQDDNTDSQLDSVFSFGFPEPGLYSIRIESESTVAGCENELTREVFILPSVEANSNLVNSGNIVDAGSGWVPGSLIDGLSSWELETPASSNSVINSTIVNETVWVTNASGSYDSVETSFMYSPCFDISELERPMASFLRTNDVDLTGGVVLQYTTSQSSIDLFNDESWQPVGDNQGGLNWYNGINISAAPGGQINNNNRIGWAGTVQDSIWQLSRNILDEIDQDDRSNVIFRFAFASTESEPVNEGFAFDDFRVLEREAVTLLEQFTNLNSPSFQNSTDSIESIANQLGDDIIDISYHTDFPSVDDVNRVNPAQPNARRTFYAITEVPYSVVDGEEDPNTFGTLVNGQLPFDEEEILVRALRPAKVDIDINLPQANIDEIIVSPVITALETIENSTDLRLFTAIIERTVELNGTFQLRNTMRRLIPDASGIPVGNSLTLGEQINIEPLQWTIRDVVDEDNLSVVVFVQDIVTQEVLQASIITVDDDKEINTITGLDDVLSTEISVFPNPADQQVNVRLSSDFNEELSWYLIDLNGTIFREGKKQFSEEGIRLDVASLPSGMYFIYLETEQGSTYKKVMVQH
ncbi:MAG: T9SS type A sorting domain-containing protein [Bacteroidota bacterium]